MQDWAKILGQKTTATRLNANLASALAGCQTLEAMGWNFRCVQCHVSSGTYPSGCGFDWHSHEEYQIEIPLTGVFEFETADRQRVVIRPKDALVIPWKFAHRWKCLQSGVMVGISLELFPTPESIKSDGWMIKSVRKLTNSTIKSNADDLVKTGLDDAHLAYYPKMIACRLFLLLADLMEHLIPAKQKGLTPEFKLAADVRGREIVGVTVQNLEQNLRSNMNLSRIANELGLSTRHLHRLFLKHVGKSLHDYMLERRLDNARRMLTEQGSKLQIKEIAYACGFNSLASFSNAFRKAYGVAPSSLLFENVLLKSRLTVKSHLQPEEAAGPTFRKKVSTSGTVRARE